MTEHVQGGSVLTERQARKRRRIKGSVFTVVLMLLFGSIAAGVSSAQTRGDSSSAGSDFRLKWRVVDRYGNPVGNTKIHIYNGWAPWEHPTPFVADVPASGETEWVDFPDGFNFLVKTKITFTPASPPPPSGSQWVDQWYPSTYSFTTAQAFRLCDQTGGPDCVVTLEVNPIRRWQPPEYMYFSVKDAETTQPVPFAEVDLFEASMGSHEYIDLPMDARGEYHFGPSPFIEGLNMFSVKARLSAESYNTQWWKGAPSPEYATPFRVCDNLSIASPAGEKVCMNQLLMFKDASQPQEIPGPGTERG